MVVLSRSLQLLLSLITLWLAPKAAPQPLPFRKSRFRLFPFRSPLLRESRLISFPGGTEMFHFPPFASLRREMTGHYTSQVSPFGHPRVTACLAARRGFSQLATPFIACLHQGILRMPLVAYPHLIQVELPLAYTRIQLYLFFKDLFLFSRFTLIHSSQEREVRIITRKEGRFCPAGSSMELIGIEPTTSGLQNRRSPN